MKWILHYIGCFIYYMHLTSACFCEINNRIAFYETIWQILLTGKRSNHDYLWTKASQKVRVRENLDLHHKYKCFLLLTFKTSNPFFSLCFLFNMTFMKPNPDYAFCHERKRLRTRASKIEECKSRIFNSLKVISNDG